MAAFGDDLKHIAASAVRKAPSTSAQRRPLLDIESGAHQVPLATDAQAASVQEPPKSHPDFDLPEHRLDRAFAPAVAVSVPRLRHDPLQLALGELAWIDSKGCPAVLELLVGAAFTTTRH